ncbi:hypothetical protein ACVB8X_02035 [Streptomyces sp. NRAIS4]
MADRDDHDEGGAAGIRAVLETAGARYGVERLIADQHQQALAALDQAVTCTRPPKYRVTPRPA